MKCLFIFCVETEAISYPAGTERLPLGLSSVSGACLSEVQWRGRSWWSGLWWRGCLCEHLFCRLDTHKCSHEETWHFPQVSAEWWAVGHRGFWGETPRSALFSCPNGHLLRRVLLCRPHLLGYAPWLFLVSLPGRKKLAFCYLQSSSMGQPKEIGRVQSGYNVCLSQGASPKILGLLW